MKSSIRKARRVLAHRLGVAPLGYVAEELNKHELEFVEDGLSAHPKMPEVIQAAHLRFTLEAFEPESPVPGTPIGRDKTVAAVGVLQGRLHKSFMPELSSDELDAVLEAMDRVGERTRNLEREGISSMLKEAAAELVERLTESVVVSGKCKECEKRDTCEALK